MSGGTMTDELEKAWKKRGARSSVLGRGTVLQSGRQRVPFSMMSMHFSIELFLPAAL
jgi:hypothetical protein